VVLIGGEAGVGKSRLTEALVESSANHKRTILRFQGAPYHTYSPFIPIIEHLKATIGISDAPGAPNGLDALHEWLPSKFSDYERALIGALLSSSAEPAVTETSSPAQRKADTIRALGKLLLQCSAPKPGLILLEDAHWMDPTTHELFESIIEQISMLPLLMVVTHRPEYSPGWGAHVHVTHILLNRLGKSDVRALVASLLTETTLSAELTEQLIEKSDGVPLFAKEMTRSVLESLRLHEAGDSGHKNPGELQAVPETLHDSLMACLDRLGKAREIIQLTATLGRDFSYRLLAAIAGDGEHFVNSLEHLVDIGLLIRRPTLSCNRNEYAFKHALVRDVAYQSLLNSVRREHHARVAACIEADFDKIRISQPEVLTRHFTEAEQFEQAIVYWRTADKRYASQAPLMEASACFEQGISIISKEAQTAAILREAIDLRFLLRRVLWPLGQHNRLLTTLEQAESLAQQLGDEAWHTKALLYLGLFETHFRCS